jgi:hypothetical protein
MCAGLFGKAISNEKFHNSFSFPGLSHEGDEIGEVCSRHRRQNHEKLSYHI